MIESQTFWQCFNLFWEKCDCKNFVCLFMDKLQVQIKNLSFISLNPLLYFGWEYRRNFNRNPTFSASHDFFCTFGHHESTLFQRNFGRRCRMWNFLMCEILNPICPIHCVFLLLENGKIGINYSCLFSHDFRLLFDAVLYSIICFVW